MRPKDKDGGEVKAQKEGQERKGTTRWGKPVWASGMTRPVATGGPATSQPSKGERGSCRVGWANWKANTLSGPAEAACTATGRGMPRMKLDMLGGL